MPSPPDANIITMSDHTAGHHTGLIDIHCHLLHGVDDGCADLDQTLTCIRRLKQAGYVGSICTPHIWAELFPHNTRDNIITGVERLRREIADAGVDYTLWPGGEVRLHDRVIDDFKAFGIPTLADSRCVLVDAWFDKWPRWMNKAFDYLLEQDYHPILAHPERLNCPNELERRLDEITQRGVLLQGNFRSLTGAEGFNADLFSRTLLRDGRYHFMALDVHRPESLESRLDGVALVEAEFDRDTLTALTDAAPRQRILS